MLKARLLNLQRRSRAFEIGHRHYDASANFDRHWDEIKDQYDGRFYRMWKFYLLASAGAFRARFNNLWQIVFSTEGVAGGYQAPR